jgi:hypothetical protein
VLKEIKLISDGWTRAIQRSSDAYKNLQRTIEVGNVQEQLQAWSAYQEAEDLREIARIEAGFGPTWPPRTQMGLDKMGLTRQQSDAMIHKMNENNLSGLNGKTND